MNESLTDLTEKQVVNMCDGKILGYIIDFQIDICCGRLTAIILPGECGVFGFRRSTDIIIPWEKICRIGRDTIIVDIGTIQYEDKKEKKRKFRLKNL